MAIRITTLSENSARMGDYLAEWGLSILVETESAKVLLDAGMGISTVHNADILGIDLSKVDKIVLSHSHRDHTGGLRDVLRRIRKKGIEIVAHPNIWANRYSRREGEEEKFMGMPFVRQELENLGAVFHLETKPVRLAENLTTSGEIPMVTEFEDLGPTSSRNVIKEENGVKPDELLDDQALIINTEQGLVVVAGCAHRGLINTLYHAKQLTGVKAIHTVVGGAHLIDASEERVWLTIAALKDLDVQRLSLCHCTGMRAITILASEFGDRFVFNSAGTIIDFP